MLEAIGDWRPEVVIHLAARVGGITANIARSADFLIDNLRIDANLLAALAVHRPRHFVPMLSTCMYPETVPSDRYPMSEALIEAGPPPPTNAAYAAAKRALWHGTLALNHQYGVPFTALVPANLYGPGDHFADAASHFLAAAVDKIENARLHDDVEVQFFGAGKALRQYLFVNDLVHLVVYLVESEPLNETLNVAPTESHSINQLAAAVAETVGYDGEIVFSGEGPDGQYQKDVSTDRLRELVPGWKAMETRQADGLRLTVDWYRAHVEPR